MPSQAYERNYAYFLMCKLSSCFLLLVFSINIENVVFLNFCFVTTQSLSLFLVPSHATGFSKSLPKVNCKSG